MKFKLKKKINDAQLFEECKAVGINLISITRDKDNNLILDADKSPLDIINNHIPKVELTIVQRVDKIQNLDDVKKFLKGEI